MGELIFLLPSPKTVRISPHNRAYRPHWPRYVSFLGDVAFLMCLPCLLLTLLSPSPAFRTHAQTHQLALLQWKWMLALTSREINFFIFVFVCRRRGKYTLRFRIREDRAKWKCFLKLFSELIMRLIINYYRYCRKRVTRF